MSQEIVLLIVKGVVQAIVVRTKEKKNITESGTGRIMSSSEIWVRMGKYGLRDKRNFRLQWKGPTQFLPYDWRNQKKALGKIH